MNGKSIIMRNCLRSIGTLVFQTLVGNGRFISENLSKETNRLKFFQVKAARL